jgi:ribonucleoside-triphosphate reductase
MGGLIEKRNGQLEMYDRQKIEKAILKALKVTKTDVPLAQLERLAAVATDDVERRLEALERPDVESIQDEVERVLMERSEYETARNYITYRYEHKRKRALKGTAQEVNRLFSDYIGQSDWEVRENSNMSYSLQGLNNHVISKMTRAFWLHEVYDETIREAHERGDLHIHDLGLLSTYCCGWSLEDLLLKGFTGVQGKVSSAPTKHFDTALMQLVNFIYTLQGEAAGAQAVSNFDTLLAPFVRADGLDYDAVKDHMQTFIFNMNIATRVGFQTPFFNLTMDVRVPSTHRQLPVIIGGKHDFDAVYGDYQREMDMINRAFCEVMMAGDKSGRVFTFPIPTYNITKDWEWDNLVTDAIMEMTAKFGIPYFSNFVSSDLDPEDVRSMCCRLRLDNKELRKRGGGLFGANPKTGSIGVVTINMARLGHVAETEGELHDRLGRLMELAKNSLELKRTVLEENIRRGLYPYSRFYLEEIYLDNGAYWHNHFSTIGPNGVNEMVLNFTDGKEDITTDKGRALALGVLDYMNERLVAFQEETGHLYNLEASPAEGTAHRFALLDRDQYPGTIMQGVDRPYYTNSTQLPVGHTEDLFEALDHQDALQTRYTGGTVFHAFLPEMVTDIESVKSLLKKVMYHYELPYFTLTPTFSICEDHKYLKGEVPECPHCGKKTEVWTRVVGYHRPVENFNDGKQSEYDDRKTFQVS